MLFYLVLYLLFHMLPFNWSFIYIDMLGGSFFAISAGMCLDTTAASGYDRDGDD